MAIYKDALDESVDFVREQWANNKALPTQFAKVKTKFGEKYLLDYSELHISPDLVVLEDLRPTITQVIQQDVSAESLKALSGPKLAALDAAVAAARKAGAPRPITQQLDSLVDELRADVAGAIEARNGLRLVYVLVKIAQLEKKMTSEDFTHVFDHWGEISLDVQAIAQKKFLAGISMWRQRTDFEIEEKKMDDIEISITHLIIARRQAIAENNLPKARRISKKELIPSVERAIPALDSGGRKSLAASLTKTLESFRQELLELEAKKKWWQLS